jgi:hypothetical protein
MIIVLGQKHQLQKDLLLHGWIGEVIGINGDNVILRFPEYPGDTVTVPMSLLMDSTQFAIAPPPPSEE